METIQVAFGCLQGVGVLDTLVSLLLMLSHRRCTVESFSDSAALYSFWRS